LKEDGRLSRKYVNLKKKILLKYKKKRDAKRKINDICFQLSRSDPVV